MWNCKRGSIKLPYCTEAQCYKDIDILYIIMVLLNMNRYINYISKFKLLYIQHTLLKKKPKLHNVKQMQQYLRFYYHLHNI